MKNVSINHDAMAYIVEGLRSQLNDLIEAKCENMSDKEIIALSQLLDEMLIDLLNSEDRRLIIDQ